MVVGECQVYLEQDGADQQQSWGGFEQILNDIFGQSLVLLPQKLPSLQQFDEHSHINLVLNIRNSYTRGKSTDHFLHKHGKKGVSINFELFGEVVLVQRLPVLFGYFNA